MAAEKNFENRIKDFLKSKGCWFIKYWSGSSSKGKTFTKEGIPDILCCCRGRFVAIEVKAANGKPKPLQIWNLKKIDEAGGYAVLLYPDQWETFKTMIELMECGCTCGQYYKKLKQTWMDWDAKLKKEGDV